MAKRAFELLCGRLQSCGSGAYADALQVLYMLADSGQVRAGKGLGAAARRALHQAGEIPSTHIPAQFFEPWSSRHVEPAVHAGASSSLLGVSPHLQDGGARFKEPVVTDMDTLPPPDSSSSGGLSRWFEPSGGVVPADMSEMLFGGATSFSPGAAAKWFAPEGAAVSPEADDIPERDLLQRGYIQPAQGRTSSRASAPRQRRRRQSVLIQQPLGQRLQDQRRAARHRRQSWDMRVETTQGGLSNLDRLWLSNVMRLEERALWQHPGSFQLLSCRRAQPRAGGGASWQGTWEWVRAAGLALHGASSDVFEVRAEGATGGQVLFRSGDCMCDGAVHSLSESWAAFSTSVLRLRRLSESLVREANCGLTAQGLGHGLQHLMFAFDQATFAATLGTSRQKPTAMGLWAWAQPWVWQMEELAHLCGLEGERRRTLPQGIALLEHLFSHCQKRQTSTCLLQAHAHTPSSSSPASELAGHYLLEKALVPYLRCVTEWVYRGNLEDPFNEFVETVEASPGSTRMTLRVPYFLRSLQADVERSGRLLRTLSITKQASWDIVGSSLVQSQPLAGSLDSAEHAAFFDHSRAHGDLTFLPEQPRSRSSASRANKHRTVVDPSLALRCSHRAILVRDSHVAYVSDVAEKNSFPSSPSSTVSRSGSPSRTGLTPLTLRQLLPDSNLGPTQTRLRREAKEVKKRQQQQAVRASLDAQVEEQRLQKEQAIAAENAAPRELSFLERAFAPAVVDAAREQILAEHVRETIEAESQAAYLQWRLRRLRLASQRRKFLFAEMEALHEELEASADKPLPQLRFGTWGPVINPFDSFHRARQEMLHSQPLDEDAMVATQSAEDAAFPQPALPVNIFTRLHAESGTQLSPLLSPARKGVADNADLAAAGASPRSARLRSTGEAAASLADAPAAGLPSGGLRAPDFRYATMTTDGKAPHALEENLSFDPWAPVKQEEDISRIVRAILDRAYKYAAETPVEARDRRTELQRQEAADGAKLQTPPRAGRRSAENAAGTPRQLTLPLGRGDAEQKGPWGDVINPFHEQYEFEPRGLSSSIAGLSRVDCAQDVSWAADEGALPLEVCMESCLHHAVRLQARLVDSAVARHFLLELRLMRRLRLLRKYILWGESRLVEPFIIETVERYASPSESSQTSTSSSLGGLLNLLFHKVVPRPADPDDDAFLSAVHFVVPANMPPSRLLDSLRIDLSVKFPLSLAFPGGILMQYSKLFRLLALVHYALHCAKAAWLEVAKGGVRRAAPLPAWVMALRHSMQYFVVVLQRYLLVDVGAAEWTKLEAVVSKTDSLDGILSAHASFLDTCARKSFLGAGSEELLVTVVTMLNQVILLKKTLSEARAIGTTRQEIGAVNAAVSRLQAIESTFLDQRRKLKLSLPDGSVSHFAGREDFLEAWLAAWARRCEQ